MEKLREGQSLSFHHCADGKSVKFRSQQDISGGSWQNSVAAFPQTTKVDGYLF